MFLCFQFHKARNPPIWPVSPIQNWTRVTHWTPKDPTAARITGSLFGTTLQWRHNEHDGVSNHLRLDCLLNRLVRRRSKKTSKLCVTGLCEGNSLVTCEFPAQRASNAEHISISWRHLENRKYRYRGGGGGGAPPWNVKWVPPCKNVF